MRADHIRELYDYHMSTNRKLWDTSIMTLTEEQFLRHLDYSVGSIRNQCMHLMSVDERWFTGLRRVELPDYFDPELFPTREAVRAQWDEVEGHMKDYLATMTHEDLDGMMGTIPTWAVLQQVVLHGMDHRAQMLVMLYSMGAPTFAQDFIYRFFK